MSEGFWTTVETVAANAHGRLTEAQHKVVGVVIAVVLGYGAACSLEDRRARPCRAHCTMWTDRDGC